ncbi:hypothetical protein CAOG_08418 [Capsaspora owczarzaki ATCC 30864]|uniref:Soluble calcium-activated nucleotidase 1 n=1 Tax=Capsaspora owczarzaki (strain ATCC 30864) TaxID=595528 RepID=A0A0D2U146_CAPO3|nr:hypothetical protein CAOG_08418 [Capsaspora owczarzaki ATCC 30864]KJE88946.1 hypothetical protein CAOG_008418 [Capsaspora owczarzaki ATCC 30864]|eukprot:XP_011269989.1 hypothetical protein CAOG_08418 [Capsaspora owczarzaki ATCC 30864]
MDWNKPRPTAHTASVLSSRIMRSCTVPRSRLTLAAVGFMLVCLGYWLGSMAPRAGFGGRFSPHLDSAAVWSPDGVAHPKGAAAAVVAGGGGGGGGGGGLQDGVASAEDLSFIPYPRTAPLRTPGEVRFRIGMVADLDQASRSPDDEEWHSFLVRGYLVFHSDTNKYSVEIDPKPAARLTSRYAEKGRGMELSELVAFHGRLLAMDDRTGIIFELVLRNEEDGTGIHVHTPDEEAALREQALKLAHESHFADHLFYLTPAMLKGSGAGSGKSDFSVEVVPRYVLSDGPGDASKGFKAEWATIKDNRLVVGGLGKEWTTGKGVVVHTHPQWIKQIDGTGRIRHLDWKPFYDAMRASTGTSFPGYLIHESAVWSPLHRQWYFLPRRASSEPYDEVQDELRGTNWLLAADERFETITRTEIGRVEPRRGFSSFKFVPYTDDNEIIAIKTEEVAGKLSSYVTIFTIYGEVLLPDTLIALDAKLEGIEFI